MTRFVSLHVYVVAAPDVDVPVALDAVWAHSDLMRAGFIPNEKKEDRAVFFELAMDEVSNSFDDRMKELLALCRKHFKSELQGYWMEEAEGCISRCEFRGDEIVFEQADWLFDYTVAQMEAIRAFAQKTFGKP